MGTTVISPSRRVPEILAAALHGYVEGARRTGRTTLMLQGLKEGDVVICPTPKAAQWINQRLHEMHEGRPPLIRIMAVEPNLYKLVETVEMNWRGVYGEVHFDHSWLEAFWKDSLGMLADELGHVADRLNERARRERERDKPPASFQGGE